MRRYHLGIALLLLLHVPATARAVDGVGEINQTCAVNTGCFPGDSPGFPVTIAGEPASFRLTSNLTTSSGSTTFIEITPLFTNTGFVIDLNGFSMRCGDTFGGDCSAGVGVGVRASGVSKVTVMNGSIVNLGGPGVELGDSCVVKDMRISESGGFGIFAGASCIVTGNGIVGNATGIFVGDGSSVLDNVVRDNGSFGLVCPATCGYGRNVFTNNSIDDFGGIGTPIEIDTNLCGNDTTCP